MKQPTKQQLKDDLATEPKPNDRLQYIMDDAHTWTRTSQQDGIMSEDGVFIATQELLQLLAIVQRAHGTKRVDLKLNQQRPAHAPCGHGWYGCDCYAEWKYRKSTKSFMEFCAEVKASASATGNESK